VALAVGQREGYTNIWTYRSHTDARTISHYSTCFPAAAALSSHPRKPLEPINSWNSGGINKNECKKRGKVIYLGMEALKYPRGSKVPFRDLKSIGK